MAEVGLLPFARIALQVSKAVLPRFRSRFSKHQFTQPQLRFAASEVRLWTRTLASGMQQEFENNQAKPPTTPTVPVLP